MLQLLCVRRVDQWHALWELFRQRAPSAPRSLGTLARTATPRVDWFDCDAVSSKRMMRAARPSAGIFFLMPLPHSRHTSRHRLALGLGSAGNFHDCCLEELLLALQLSPARS